MPRDAKGNPVPVLYGDQAVQAIELLENRKLSKIEKRIVHEEGFVPKKYLDTKGIETYGVGQTGKWIKKGFKASFDHHVQQVRKMVPGYDNLPEYLQEELVQAGYRGDLGGSPTTRKHINNGDYRKAAVEFLDNQEFRDPKTPQGIKIRMKRVSDALLRYDRERQISQP